MLRSVQPALLADADTNGSSPGKIKTILIDGLVGFDTDRVVRGTLWRSVDALHETTVTL